MRKQFFIVCFLALANGKTRREYWAPTYLHAVSKEAAWRQALKSGAVFKRSTLRRSTKAAYNAFKKKHVAGFVPIT